MKRMNKFISAIVILCMSLAMSCMLTGCGSGTGDQDDSYDPGAIIIKYQISPSFGAYDEMYAREISLDVDQNVITVRHLKLYDDDGNSYDYGLEPVLWEDSAEISDTDSVKDVYAIVSGNKYNKLDDDLRAEIMDGDFTYIYVEKENEIISKKGGLGAAFEGPNVFTDVCEKLTTLAKKAGLY